MQKSHFVNAFLIGTTAIAVAGAAIAQNPEERVRATRAQAQPAAADEKFDGTVFHAQVLLDRAGFSPGVIDGMAGIALEAALKGFQQARGLEVTGELDNPTRAALLQDRAQSTRRLRIDESDAQGPFGPVPKEPEDQAKLDRLPYRNLLEKIAEKFHTTPRTNQDVTVSFELLLLALMPFERALWETTRGERVARRVGDAGSRLASQWQAFSSRLISQ